MKIKLDLTGKIEMKKYRRTEQILCTYKELLANK
jgi:hypothetical protein